MSLEQLLAIPLGAAWLWRRWVVGTPPAGGELARSGAYVLVFVVAAPVLALLGLAVAVALGSESILFHLLVLLVLPVVGGDRFARAAIDTSLAARTPRRRGEREKQ